MPHFRQEVWHALQERGQPPEELVDYQTSQAFWQNMGLTQKDLDEWPPDKIDRYLTVMEVVGKYRTAMQHKAGS